MKKKLLLSLALIAAVVTSAAVASHVVTMKQMPTENAVSMRANTLQAQSRALTIEKVLRVVTLKNGMKMEYAKCSDGMVHKIMLNNDGKIANRISKSTKLTAAGDTTFFEGFEGWDGKTYDWIPAGWQDISKAGHVAPADSAARAKEMNLTWTVSSPFWDATPDGSSYYAYCQNDVPDTIHALTDNDEWLITPAITPKTGDHMYTYAKTRPGWTLLNMDTFSAFDAKNNWMEVYVTADDGANWTKVWDSYEVAKAMTEAELWADVYSMSGDWQYVSVNLDKYVGKQVKLAFRYAGKNGNPAAVDEVFVGQPTPGAAAYMRPQGAFYAGLTEDYHSYNNGLLLTPAFQDMTFSNASSVNAETFQWTYANPNDTAAATSTEKDLAVNYPAGDYTTPTLAAHVDGIANDSIYKWTGGNAKGYVVAGGTLSAGLGNYDLGDQFIWYRGDSNGTPLFGYSSNSDTMWTGVFGLTKTDTTNVKLNYIANFFEAPLRPYTLSRVTINGMGTFASDAELKLNVIRIDGNGYLADTLATATCTASDVIKTTSGSDTYVTIPFDLAKLDPETGLTEPTTLEVNSALFVSLSGFQNSGNNFKLFQSYKNAIGKECNGYFGVTITKGSTVRNKMYSIGDAFDDMYNSFLFNLDATYTWMNDKNGNTEEEFDAAAAGESKTFPVEAFYNSQAWTAKYSAQTYVWDGATESRKAVQTELDTIPTWLHCTLADSTVTDTTGTSYTGLTKVTFTADALPSNMTGRNCTVKFSIPASSMTFTIIQGDGSVKVVRVDNTVKVARSGEDFLVKYPAGVNDVKIYNISGQMVANVTLDGSGNSIIPGSSLAHGMYIMQFSNGSIAKVMK